VQITRLIKIDYKIQVDLSLVNKTVTNMLQNCYTNVLLFL